MNSLPFVKLRRLLVKTVIRGPKRAQGNSRDQDHLMHRVEQLLRVALARAGGAPRGKEHLH
jgi:hypothetical protein